MPQAATIIKADASGRFKLPLAQGEVARIDVVDVDIVVQGTDGSRFILAGAGLDAMNATPPDVAFTDGTSNAARLLEAVGQVETPDVSVPVMSSLTEHDAKTTSGPKSFHGDGTDTIPEDEAPSEADLEAQAEAQTDGQPVATLDTASDTTVEAMVQKVSNAIESLHNKAADPVAETPYEPPAAASPGVGAAPNPVSLTPLVVISLGNVVGTTSTTSGSTTTINASGGETGTTATDGYSVRDPAQFSTETITGTSGNDVIYADGTDVGGVSYNADGTVAGNADGSSTTATFAKEMLIQISGYFTSLTSITISELPTGVSLSGTGITQNADGSWNLPISYLTSETTFKIVYPLSEEGTVATQSFVMTVTINGVTRSVAFTSETSFTVWISDADSADDISQTDSDGSSVYVLPAQGTPNYIDAGAGDDTISAGYGNDTIYAGEGDDIVYAGYGNDLIHPGKGGGTVYAGNGTDTVSFSELTDVGVTANLATETTTVDGVTGTIHDVENLEGTNQDDTLTGDANTNVLSGLDGADTLNGGGGADTILGGDGADTIVVSAASASASFSGGDGIDTLDLTADTSAHVINMATGSASGGYVDGATLSDFEVLKLGSGADTVTDGAGNDTYYGGSGNDIFTDAAGNDTYYGEAGNDRFYGGDGADVVDGGSGFDYMYYTSSSSGVTVSLDSSGNSTVASGGDAEGDQLFGIEYLLGSNYDDTLTYDSASGTTRYLRGYNGNDTLEGGAGNDSIWGGNGDDFLTGNAGNDYLSGESGVDSLWGGDGNDVLDGGSGNDYLSGGAGADTLNGSTGSDVLEGGSGDDILIYSASSSAGNDTLDGGADTDTLDCSSSINSVTVFLVDNTSTTDIAAGERPSNVPSDLASGDGFVYSSNGSLYSVIKADSSEGNSSIENITGSSSSDVLVGDDDANTILGYSATTNSGNDHIYGLGGDDILVGGDQNDVIYGGDGNDTLYGYGGYDTLDGGSGDDLIYVPSSGLADLVSVSGGEGTDTLVISGVSDLSEVTSTEALSKISSIEVLDVQDGAGGGTYGLTAEQVQGIADNGTSSAVTLRLDSGDIFTADVGSGYVTTTLGGSAVSGSDLSSTSGVDVTYYYYDASNQLQATVSVDY